MEPFFSNKIGCKKIKEKFDRLKKIYITVEQVRAEKQLTISLVDANKIADRRNKGLPVVWSWPLMHNCPETWDFVVCLEEDGWQTREFDTEEGYESAYNLENIRNADFNKIRRLLTYFVTGERFCDGHWAHAINIGFVKALMDRLEIIIQDDDEICQ